MDDPYDLVRFRTAQDDGGTYDTALAELRAGRKRSHWMWFVFPQLAGLGRSETARFYAIRGRAEAAAYLADPVLADRLRESAQIVMDGPATSAVVLLGDVDALKLHSSMTLFDAITGQPSVFAAVLDRYFEGRPDEATVRLL